jgi:integrase
MATFSIKLDERVLLRGGKYNVVIRIFDRDTHLDLRIKRMVKSQFIKTFKRHAIDEKSIELREYCNEQLSRSEKIYRSIGYLNKDRIRERFYNDPSPPVTYTIREMFDYYKKTTNKRLSTYERMSSSITSICKFKPNLRLEEINTQLLMTYDKHLLERKLAVATIAGYMKDIRTVINHCNNTLDDFSADYSSPFGKRGYSIQSGFTQKKVMDLEELTEVLNMREFESKYDEFALDIWQLLFYSNGINFIDALLLKWSDIDNEVIRFMRRKTITTRKNNVRLIEIPIDKDIKRIINQCGNRESEYVFGLIDNEEDEKYLYSKNKYYRRKLNKSLRSISEKLDLKVPLRLKTARDTYATSLYRLGAPKDQIGEMMGHSNSKVTEHYFGSLGVDGVTKINQLLPRRES